MEKQNQVTYTIIKKICNTYKYPYKYTKTTILLAAHKETAIAIATNMKKNNIFFSIVGGWYKELKVKEFCVFDYIKLLYRATIF